MTDTRARDALAAALIRTGMYVDAGIDTSAGLDKPTVYAEAILTDEDITPDQRRALAAAFLDAETLCGPLHETAVHNHNIGEGPQRAVCPDGSWHGKRAAAILAALRETP